MESGSRELVWTGSVLLANGGRKRRFKVKCEICGTPYKSYYPEFREIEQQCTCPPQEQKDAQIFEIGEAGDCGD